MDVSFASPMLSPSKVRKDAAQAKDWAYITSWLSRKYHPSSTPPFERNDSTLETLLVMASLNDAVDEEAEILYTAQVEEVNLLRTRVAVDAGVNGQLVAEVERCITAEGATALGGLAETGIQLGTLTTEAQDLADAIMKRTRAEYEAEKQLCRIEELQSYFEGELAAVKRHMQTLNTDTAYNAPVTLPTRNAEWNQGTKMLSIKLREYRERIAVLERYEVACAKIEDLKTEEKDLIRLREKIKGLERRVQSFHGLPPDTGTAKIEYSAAEAELSRVIRQRDAIFGGLLGGESGSKKRR